MVPIFQVSYAINALMLFAQAVIILNVARDNFSVFYDEHTNSSISRDLEKRKHGYDKKSAA